MLVPISNQLPLSFTRKKKLSVMTSVTHRLRRNKEKAGKSRIIDNAPKIEDKRAKGVRILSTNNPPIKKGLNVVVSLYTD